jgi:hypothetical protein
MAWALLFPLLASPNTITIRDVNFGAPVVTLDWYARVIASPDSVRVNGMIATPTGTTGLPIGLHSVLLMDPAANHVSDFLTLNISARINGMQRVSLVFESESAPGFAAAVAALRALPGARTAQETTGLLDLSGLLNSGNLAIRLDSGSRAVPDHGSTLLLLGASMLGVYGFVRRTKHSGTRVPRPSNAY